MLSEDSFKLVKIIKPTKKKNKDPKKLIFF